MTDESAGQSGQKWLLVKEQIEWGLEDYFIVNTDNGRLILCDALCRPLIKNDLRVWPIAPVL